MGPTKLSYSLRHTKAVHNVYNQSCNVVHFIKKSYCCIYYDCSGVCRLVSLPCYVHAAAIAHLHLCPSESWASSCHVNQTIRADESLCTRVFHIAAET